MTAVIGGQQVHALGYQFVLTPVISNALLIVTTAVIINWVFEWRRYPAALKASAPPPRGRPSYRSDISHEDFVSALESIGTFVDISEEEFLQLREFALASASRRHIQPQDLKLGSCYSNGALGDDWAVRQIVDASPDNRSRHGGSGGEIIWQVVAGRDRNATGVASRQTMAEWAAYEVSRSESTWVRTRSDQALAKSGPRQPELAEPS